MGCLIRLVIAMVGVLSLLSSASGQGLPGQGLPPGSAEPGLIDRDLEWRRIGKPAGMPSTHVTYLSEGRSGLLWVGTRLGLCTYDGYGVSPCTGTPASRVQAVIQLPTGRTLAILEDRLYHGDSDGFEKLPLCDRAGRPLVIFSVARFDASRLIILARTKPAGQRAVYLLKTGSFRVLPRSALPSVLASCAPRYLCPSSDGGATALLVAESGIFRIHDGQIDEDLNRDPYQRTSCVALCGPRLGLLGVNEMAGRVTYGWSDQPQLEQIRAFGKREPIAMAIAGDGDAAVATETGRLFFRQDGRWRETRKRPRQSITQLLISKHDGTLWAGSSGGLWLRQPKLWYHCRAPSGDSRNRVHGFLLHSSGEVWAATGAGVQALTGLPRRASFESRGLAEHSITTLAETRAGEVWAGSYDSMVGVFRLRQGVWRRLGPELGLNFHARDIHVDGSDRVWFAAAASSVEGVGVSGPGVFYWDESAGRCLRWPHSDGLVDQRVTCIRADHLGGVWFATPSGLSRFAEGVFRHWTTRDGLIDDRVELVQPTADGGALFTHQQYGVGIIEMPSGQVSYVRDLSGTDPSDVLGLMSDATSGRLWLSSRSGPCLLIDKTAMPIGSWNQPHRLRSIACNSECLLIGSLGSGVGILALDSVDRHPPRIIVADLVQRIPVGDPAIVRLQWAAISPLAQTRVRQTLTRVLIDDQPAGPWSYDRFLNVELAAGEHTLRIEARGMLGESSFKTVPITVALPLHSRAWFIASGITLVAFLLGTLSFGWVRRRRYASELAKRAANYHDLVENAHDLVFTLDRSGQILTVNRAAECSLGYSREELKGRAFADLVAPNHREAWHACRRDVELDLGPLATHICGADGSYHELELNLCSSQPEPDGSAQGYLLAIARDLSARRQVEQQLQQAQKMESIGKFAGGIAHDFNNILVGISGYCDLVMDEVSDQPALRSDLDEIQAACGRAAGLVKQLLAFSRKQIMEPREFDLNESLSEWKDMLQRLVGDDVTLELTCSSRPAMVCVDPTQTHQILLNLVVNARDAMPEGGRLSIVIVILEDAEGAWVRLSVEDDGRGIPESEFGRIFEPFFTTKPGGKSSGLGLSTVYGIVKQLDGRIQVSSPPGHGARFDVDFPLHTETVTSSVTQAPAETPRCPTGRGEHIMLVEDEASVRLFMGRSLRKNGYQVTEMADPLSALKQFEQNPDAIDILVTDVVMPGMSGTELARRMQRRRADVRVLLVSGYPGDEIDQRGTVDCQSYLTKPFGSADLAGRIRVVLDSTA